MRFIIAAALVAFACAGSARAEERDFCGDRPGLGDPACTIDPGHLQAELGLADWTRDKSPDSRTDTLVAGDLLLRYGLGQSTEVRLGWTGYGHVRVRDRITGAIGRASRTGDATLGLKQNLMNPDGAKLSIALLPTLSLPVGRRPIGAGDWGAALEIPITYALSDAIQLELVPDAAAAVDGDGNGRHLAYGGVIGIGLKASAALTITAEAQAVRDRDPAGHATESRASLSLAYMAGKNVQLDAGAVAALNRNTPDAELYFGIAERF